MKTWLTNSSYNIIQILSGGDTPYANDINKMVNSWGLLLETGCTQFIPGHGTVNDRVLVQKEYNKRR